MMFRAKTLRGIALVAIALSVACTGLLGFGFQRAMADDLMSPGLLAQDGSNNVLSYTVEATYGQTEARSMLPMINEFRQGDDAWYGV